MEQMKIVGIAQKYLDDNDFVAVPRKVYNELCEYINRERLTKLKIIERKFVLNNDVGNE